MSFMRMRTDAFVGSSIGKGANEAPSLLMQNAAQTASCELFVQCAPSSPALTNVARGTPSHAVMKP
jgi:hypothetical protein